MSHLFSPLTLRELTFKNRVFVSPMCQYSSLDGMPTDWHLVHLGSRAIGGAALVIVEATAVSPEGRISPFDSGMWSAEHGRAFRRITKFLKEHGAVPGVQLAHAGRKASTAQPWNGGGPVTVEEGGWIPMAPSPVPFDKGYPTPREMSADDIEALVARFRDAARWSLDGGFEVVEIHAAHGYLLHQFLSPLSNRRADGYGGSLENRMKVPLRVTAAVREVWPATWPVFVRISATDWADGGWDLPQSIEFARALKSIGVDLIDCSSGGLVPHAKIQVGPGYQVPFAEAIRREAGIATGAVGMITEPRQADQIIAGGQADAILIARELLRNPYWPLHAADELGDQIEWPVQYGRGRKR
jgi:2,4-dienoyl-CoA reductase-like NADH-dependent reductase (Old Yellow Enzyme family)